MSNVNKRRGTIVEEAADVLIESKIEETETKKLKKKNFKEQLQDIGHELYNSEYREFLGRDSKAWAKLTLFFFLFFALLSCFYLLMVFIFYQFVDDKTPTYYNKESVMDYKGVNPGLGFRPQIDPESELIKIITSDQKSWRDSYFQSMEIFLQNYEKNKNKNFTGAHGRKVTFDYESVIKNTPCARSNFYGLNKKSPCVIVKLNRIYGWLPIAGHKPPYNVSKPENSHEKYIYIACSGESGVDNDNIGKLDYYSGYPTNEIGGVNFKYFPYRNQPGYLSPLVFVHFKNIAKNVLVNVECKAYAKNIDNQDRLHRRGMVKFQLYVAK